MNISTTLNRIKFNTKKDMYRCVDLGQQIMTAPGCTIEEVRPSGPDRE